MAQGFKCDNCESLCEGYPVTLEGTILRDLLQVHHVSLNSIELCDNCTKLVQNALSKLVERKKFFKFTFLRR